MKYLIPSVISSFIMGLCVGLLCSCTYSITMIHTEGTASDVVDLNQKADADVDATVSIPATAL